MVAQWSALELSLQDAKLFLLPPGRGTEQVPVNRRMMDRDVNRLSRKSLLQAPGRQAYISSSISMKAIIILRYLKARYGAYFVNCTRIFVHVTHALMLVVEKLHLIASILPVCVASATQVFVTVGFAAFASDR